MLYIPNTLCAEFLCTKYTHAFKSRYDVAMEKTIIATDAAPSAIGPYSQAVRVGDHLFTSGQIPLNLSGEVVGDDIQAQTEQVLKNLKAVLEAGGSSIAQVIKCTCFIKDMNDFAAMNEIYANYFTGTPPARSAVEVARLPKDVLIEIEAIAIVS